MNVASTCDFKVSVTFQTFITYDFRLPSFSLLWLKTLYSTCVKVNRADEYIKLMKIIHEWVDLDA